MRLPEELKGVRDYYAGRLAEFGATPQGVDWNSAESQNLRFAQLLKIAEPGRALCIGDYGCGYGALVDHLLAGGGEFSYVGFDISEDMIASARSRYGRRPECIFASEESVLDGADYLVASGIFNVKLDTPVPQWQEHVLATLDRFAALTRLGFAFNALTSYSDPERMRTDLYYPDPCFLFDRCKRRYSRNVALLHDYNLYEFTIFVRL